MSIYSSISQNKKQFAVLVDPDSYDETGLLELCKLAEDAEVDYFFIGGSLITKNKINDCTQLIKENCKLPIVLFPGDPIQIDEQADAILLLSLISGRNPDLLIGKHVVAAPYLKSSKLEILPTGYLIIDSGNQLLHYISVIHFLFPWINPR